MARICQLLDKTRTGFYKQRTVREKQYVDQSIVLDLVSRERELMPRLGGIKLFVRIQPELKRQGIKIGRDKLFKLLREHGLLVPRIKAFTPKTTKFDPSLKISTNLICDSWVSYVNQVWVADITYLRLSGGFCYLSLIMDRYSRKVVGWHVAETLKTADTLVALEMALQTLTPDSFHPIHHSDRGCQYASHDYYNALIEAGLKPSMTEELHCYENAHAERLNGILKDEFSLGCTFQTIEQARKATEQAITVYNNCRPHGSLGYKTPQAVYEAA